MLLMLPLLCNYYVTDDCRFRRLFRRWLRRLL